MTRRDGITVGELIDLLLKFDRRTKVFAKVGDSPVIALESEDVRLDEELDLVVGPRF